MKNYNSTKNQQITRQLVNKEVVANASVLISECQQSENFSDEILDLFYSTPDYYQAVGNYLHSLTQQEMKELCAQYDVTWFGELDAEVLCDDLNLAYDYVKPLEFWIVTDYLGEKLRERKEVVAEFMGFTIWGRTTTISEQDLLLDNYIRLIAKNMEILEGISNEW